MLSNTAILISAAICATAGALEGLCAGTGVRAFFATLRFPRYSAPLWLWSIIGASYYLTFAFVLYRLLLLGRPSGLQRQLLALIVFMMLANALANIVIFRLRDLRLDFFIGAAAPVFDLALLFGLLQLDRRAALALVPYLLYRVYAVWWCYGLWTVNAPAA